LMNLPSSDFSLCLYLISERLHNEEPIRVLISLAHLLESAQFPQFWTEANTCRELLNTIPGFDDSIRIFIINLLTQTYRTISRDTLSELLNIRGNELDSLINSFGWKQSSDDQSITFSVSSSKTNIPTSINKDHSTNSTSVVSSTANLVDTQSIPKSQKRPDHSKIEELPRILQCLRY